VVDVLRREHRDLDSARAFFPQATGRRGSRPKTVVTDKHPAYGRAVRRHARRATHVRTGLHRARGETTKPVERSHATIEDRLRALRGLRSIASGQRVLEAIEGVQALRRGDLCRVPGGGAPALRPSARARYEAQILIAMAAELRGPRSSTRWPRPE
jgi:transposase-like protein